MRKARIDELPQVSNVIKEDSHFVDQRPERYLANSDITGLPRLFILNGANTEDARSNFSQHLCQ